MSAYVAGGATHEVGPGKAYDSVGAVPWESLKAGDTVRIHWRSTPYHEKWVLCARGTAESPVTVSGVPGPGGDLPVIDGSGATTRDELDFWGEDRAILKIGGSNTPADVTPEYVVVENLVFRSARPPLTFTGRNGRGTYRENAAAVWIEKGRHVTLRNCVLQDCGNGLMASHESGNVLIEGCHITGNGTELGIYQHNVYTECEGITFQFNHFGPLRDKAFGNNLKDRSSGTVIRYNWIEGGNRCLDLVDSDYEHIYGRADYRETFVYGNVLIKLQDTTNNQICHYGGDSGEHHRYRDGTLYFYHNTVISHRPYKATLIRFETGKETGIVRNNLFWCSLSTSRIRPLLSAGNAYLADNWWPEWFRVMFRFIGETEGVHRSGEGHFGDDPGFMDGPGGDYRLSPDSPCVNAAGALPETIAEKHPVLFEYVPHRGKTARGVDGAPAIGAFECASSAAGRAPVTGEGDR